MKSTSSGSNTFVADYKPSGDCRLGQPDGDGDAGLDTLDDGDGCGDWSADQYDVEHGNGP